MMKTFANASLHTLQHTAKYCNTHEKHMQIHHGITNSPTDLNALQGKMARQSTSQLNFILHMNKTRHEGARNVTPTKKYVKYE